MVCFDIQSWDMYNKSFFALRVELGLNGAVELVCLSLLACLLTVNDGRAV